jgi:DNA-binding HxlR family transcriptional regulator
LSNGLYTGVRSLAQLITSVPVKRTPFSDWPCSIARSMDLLGDWWTPLVLRDAFFGVKRFEDFQRDLGIGRNVLTQRLHRLVDEGLFERVPYQEHPVRHEYVLTDKGRDFMPVLMAMSAWGDRWLSAPEGPPITFTHKSCAHPTEAHVVCSHCGESIVYGGVRASRGPGYPT